MDKNLLAILACPICKGNLEWDKQNNVLICHPDKLSYPIRDDIPVLIAQEATPLAVDENHE